MDQAASQPGRPCVMGTRHVAVAGHHAAAQAAVQILEAGGNAIDAGVAGGIAINVLESEFASFGGVAPIVIYLAETGEVVTISGLGGWPRAASAAFFHEHHGGTIPWGVLRTVVPAAPDAWVTALERYGTMTFGDVAGTAIRLARGGFPMYPFLAGIIEEEQEAYRSWPTSAPIYLPGGRVPKVGEIFVQSDLAGTLQYLVDEEASHARNGRAAGLQAVRAAFYRGDIAARIVRFHEESGGLMTADDLANFRVGIEAPTHTQFRDIDVYGCGFWCQGPMLLQILNLLEGFDLAALGHNSMTYIHTVVEAIKLAAADREAYYGDPKFVDVPEGRLLSKEYAAQRRRSIRADKAWPEMPSPGTADGEPAPDPARLDTSYLCVVDGRGNAFSATPSDESMTAPIVPGTGFVPSARGAQSWADPGHPSSVAPGKRPRLTPSPALAIRGDGMVMPFGTPGGDVQTQALAQVFLNTFVFAMDPQSAVEAPRFATYSFPSSNDPHPVQPGLLKLEGRIDATVGDGLADLGHQVEWWPERTWLSGSTCLVRREHGSGILQGAADPRRSAYASGW